MNNNNNVFDTIFGNNYDYTCICGLHDEIEALYLYNFFNKKNKSILVVTSSLYEANNLYQNLSNYTNKVNLFPMDDFLTSEALAISPELKIKRLETLNKILTSENLIVVTNLMGYLRYLPETKVYNDKRIKLVATEEYDTCLLKEKLYSLGYKKETTVNKTGEVATRGFVIDIFPINTKNPVRIEFWGDQIDSIREFDVDTQLTIKKINELEILPCTEFLTNTNIDNYDIKQKYLVKYGNVVNIVDYLNNPLVIFENYQQIKFSYERLLDEIFNYNQANDINQQEKYMFDFYDLNPKNSIYLEKLDEIIDNVNNTLNIKIKTIEPFLGNTEKINQRLDDYIKNKTVIICLSNRYKANKVIDDLQNENIVFTSEDNIVENKINIIVKSINSSFEYSKYIIIAEKELFNKKENYYSYKTNFKLGTKVRDISKLNVGDYIVHSINGIGIYCGIKTLTKNGLKKDYLYLEYKDGDKLYVPVENMELITKYSSNEGATPKLSQLGGSQWAKMKMKVKAKLENIAGDLLKLYSDREASVGYAFLKDTPEQQIFEDEFPYTETPDQLKAIKDIKKDMENKRPMDRLLCGDVGYGKTEVAFRAIFKAIMSSKQVAFLCPTTILSNQHYKNAIERFKSFPINIALLNRFVSKKEVDDVLKRLKEGKIDLLIGTHRILSNDIIFKDLGLLVIDEEQRFGVKHKEKIKKYKVNVDVLTLSATPIPRTLQMSMSGIRGLSLIETPPVNRYPIQTYVLAENNNIIKDAIYKELSRNGQVFMLFNNVEMIESKAKEISRMIPESRVIYAHGQMDKVTLENVMMKFIDHEYDILVCTTIIETGIDIPSVNTLIIFDADRFGLSQLYQIRGRVGRSNKIAYCYLMYKNEKVLSTTANKRLEAIKEFTELGSGFAIAMRDLSIRGAGDILGSEQAGFVDSIGIELFLKMLNDEIEKAKGNKVENKESVKDTQPLIEVETSIDDGYVDDEELKIQIHKKINEIDSYEKLNETKHELEDRFGKISETMLIYMYEEWFEKLAKKLDITDIKQTKNFIEIKLSKELTNKLNGQELFNSVVKLSRNFRFSLKEECFIIILDTVNLDKHFIYYLIDMLELLEKNIKNC